MKEAEFRKLQLHQLDIFKELHRLCIKHGIKYYMIGGTLLGAVRHKGFIPWDVDIDVAMFREDYDKFAACCEKSLNQRFYYQNYKTDKVYYSPHAKIYIKNTKIILSHHKYSKKLNVPEGIYIDIFPLDKVPNGDKERRKQRRRLLLIRKIKQYKDCKIHKQGILYYKNMIKKTIRFALRLFPLDWLNELENRTMQKYNYDYSLRFVASMASHYDYYKQIMPTEMYGNTTLLEFEDGFFYGPEKIHEYLDQIYGDYMKLPPEEERYARLRAYIEIVFDEE